MIYLLNILFTTLCLSSVSARTVLNVIQTAEKSRDRLSAKVPISLTSGDVPVTDKETISIDLSKTFQKIKGFGGAFTDSTAWLYDQLDDSKKKEVMEAYFGESGHKYTLCRLQIGSSGEL